MNNTSFLSVCGGGGGCVGEGGGGGLGLGGALL